MAGVGRMCHWDFMVILGAGVVFTTGGIIIPTVVGLDFMLTVEASTAPSASVLDSAASVRVCHEPLPESARAVVSTDNECGSPFAGGNSFQPRACFKSAIRSSTSSIPTE